MKIPHLVLVLAVAAFAACKRAPQTAVDLVPVKEVVGDTPMIDFVAEEAGFSCRAPRDWGMREKFFENKHGAAFVGRPVGGRSTLAYITIRRYPESESQYNDARAYAETFWMLSEKGQPEITEEKIGGRTVLRFHYERPYYKPHSRKLEYMNRFDYALFPIKGGFFQIEHRAPVAEYKATLPIFEAVVRSFKPQA